MPESDRSATRDRPPKRRGRPPFQEHDLGSVDRMPWGTHGRGTPARGIVLTPLGWQQAGYVPTAGGWRKAR